MTNADQKAAIRERMASTGENYTTAKRAIELARLKAQSEQLDSTLAEQRTRTLNERFDTVAEQLGSDKSPAVRLAAVYAMAGLADDWQDHRQMCVDVLCAYLRMPYEPEPGDDAPVEKRLALQASREVRHTVIRVIAAHLNGTAPVSWCGLNFDFAGAVFDGGDFSGAKFSGGTVNFSGAEFSGGTVNFAGAEFSGGTVTSPAPSSPGRGSTSSSPSSPGRWSTSPAPSSPAGRSTSATPGSPAGRSTSLAPSSPARRSTSSTPSSPAKAPSSPAPAPPAGRSSSTPPSSPAGRSASPCRVLQRDGRLQPGRELDAASGLWVRFRYVPSTGRCHAADSHLAHRTARRHPQEALDYRPARSTASGGPATNQSHDPDPSPDELTGSATNLSSPGRHSYEQREGPPGFEGPSPAVLIDSRHEQDAVLTWLLPAEAVEFSVSYASEKSVPFVGCESEHRPLGVPAVADANLTFG